MTANDAPNRDPVKWTLEGSNDGDAWTVCSRLTLVTPNHFCQSVNVC